MVAGLVVGARIKRRLLQRRIREADARNKRLAQLDLREETLLEDKDLIESTNLASFDKRLSVAHRHRHDVCVQFRQKNATESYRGQVSRLRATVATRRELRTRTGISNEDVVTGFSFANRPSSQSADDAAARHHSHKHVTFEASSPWGSKHLSQSAISGRLAGDSDSEAHHAERSDVVKQIVKSFASGNWQLSRRQRQESDYETWALCSCFSQENAFRRFCIRLVSNERFDQVILTLISLGSLLMVFDTPGLEHQDPQRMFVLQICEELLLYIFTLEVFFKVAARGLVCGRRTYLRDHWNKLDAIVIFGGWVSMLINQVGSCRSFGLLLCATSEMKFGPTGLNALRTIRLLRPLRAIKRLPGMKTVLNGLFQSLPELLDALVLTSFALVLFGIVGVQLYMGVLQQRCVPADGYNGTFAEAGGGQQLCRLPKDDEDVSVTGCPAGFFCQASTGVNPNSGVTSFDNLPLALLAVFQSVTLEGWVDIMYDVRKVSSYVHDAYFIALVLFCSLFVTNLVVGTLVANFMALGSVEAVRSLEAASKGERVEEAVHHPMWSSSKFYSSLLEIDLSEQGWCLLRIWCFRLSRWPPFSDAVTVLIVFNTIALALDNVINDTVLDNFNLFFSCIFFVEMLIKVYGLGPTLYCKDTFNIFDFVIVMVSVFEIVMDKAFDIRGPSMTVLRSFRLLRVFKLARALESLRKILEALLLSMASIVDLGLLLVLFTFVCALTGMAFFGCVQEDRGDPDAKWSFHEDDGHMYKGLMSRPNFSSFLYSMTSVFIIITGENWNEILYTAIQTNGWLSAIYFVFIMVVGNYIVLNLFLAVLIENFDKADDAAIREKEEAMTRGDLNEMDKTFTERWNSVFQNITQRLNPRANFNRLFPVVSSRGDDGDCPDSRRTSVSSATSMASVSSTDYTGNPMSPRRLKQKQKRNKDVVQDEGGFTGKALFLLGPKNRFRLTLWDVIRHPHFDNFIYGLIAVSSILLAMDSPSVKDPNAKHTFRVMDIMLTGIFTGEATLKIAVYGFIFPKNSYMRDWWNVLDFFVVATSVFNLLLQETGAGSGEIGHALQWIKGLRALRALRPLRMVSRNEGMKAVVDAIFLTVPAILDVMFVMLVFMVAFGILGVQLLKNRFWRCSCQDYCPEKVFNPQGSLAAGQPAERLCQGVCPGAPAHSATCSWERHPMWSFDNIAWATLTLFEVATLEQWPDIMWLAVDGGSWDSGPEYNKSPLLVLFFICYLFFMSFFILNLFVGVVIDKFTDVRDAMNGEKKLSFEQRQWVGVQRLLLKAAPRPLIVPPDSRWRQLALQVVSMRSFEAAIVALIFANILVMCTSFHGASEGIVRLQETSNSVFLAIFAAEAALKMFALQPAMYFRDSWNTFDFTIVLGSLITATVTSFGGFPPFDTTTLRVFRIARVFRLVKSLASLRKKFETLVSSLPSLVNVGAMLFLLFFVYAVAGMALFGDIRIKNNPHLRFMNEDVNFQSFYLSMMMLLRMSTGESWNGIMHDCFSGALCDDTGLPECGNTFVATVFFVSFMIIGSFVFLNLFIAVIIEKIFDADGLAAVERPAQASLDNSQFDMTISEVEITDYIDAWSRFAPNGEMYIPTIKLPELLRQVSPPLGFSGETITNSRFLRLIKNLEIRDHGSHVHFAETLWRLASMVVGADMRDVAELDVLRNLEKSVLRAFPPPRPRWSKGPLVHVVYMAAEVFAAIKVQSLFRARQAQKQIYELIQCARKSFKYLGGRFANVVRKEIRRSGNRQGKVPNLHEFAARWAQRGREAALLNSVVASEAKGVLDERTEADVSQRRPDNPGPEDAATRVGDYFENMCEMPL